jgi:hypothetical protein
MKAISDKQREAREAEGDPFPFSTLRRKSPKKTAAAVDSLPPELRRRASKTAAPRYTGPNKLTVDIVWKRDFGRCGWCGRPIDPDSVRGFDWSVGHRRPRQMGGDPRPDTNLPSNLELLHGSGVSLCHGELETKRRGEAQDRGHLLSGEFVPSQHAIEHAVHGWCYLTDDGDWSTVPPEAAA